MIRYRITFSKFGPLRYISHLELQRVWSRVLLRAKIPLTYTQGFHPTIKMGVAWPLPLGWTGEAELIDFWFEYPTERGENSLPEELQDRIDRAAPDGLRATGLRTLEPYGHALTTVIDTADYLVEIDGDAPSDLSARIEELLARPTIERMRRKRAYDLRPLIETIEPTGPASFRTRMAARDSAMGRPDELLDELRVRPGNAAYTRLKFNLLPGE